jgi:hypothetical protein
MTRQQKKNGKKNSSQVKLNAMKMNSASTSSKRWNKGSPGGQSAAKKKVRFSNSYQVLEFVGNEPLDLNSSYYEYENNSSKNDEPQANPLETIKQGN